MDKDFKVTKDVLDVTAGTITVSALVGWLPAAAALITILYTAIRVYETKTVQDIIAALRSKPVE